MKEKVIGQVLMCMQGIATENQLIELKEVLYRVLCSYEIAPAQNELQVMNASWMDDLEDFLMSKALEGKSVETIRRYRYELSRLLSYINKGITDITDGDISDYMRAYKKLRKISNQTLKNVRAVYSSFFSWLRDRDRIRKNPMVLVEGIKVEQKIRKPYSDEERERLLRQCKSLRDKAMMEFMYSTVVRVSELVSLDRSDIQFASKDLIVYGKGSKERRVY